MLLILASAPPQCPFKSGRTYLVWCVVCALLMQTTVGAEFDAGVQTLLKAHCVRCHGPNQPKAMLDLSSVAGLARGGDSGAVVTPGRPEKSLLWERVKADEMPPKHPLSAADKAVLEAWIIKGALGLTDSAGAGHWAFRPLESPQPPPLNDTQRVRGAVDRHLQARLESKGLGLSQDADPRVLIRRVSLDVTGLPPTPEDIEAFLADESPHAHERMVERYLASHHYGERWGKHWLDAAGYADSNGYFSADTDRPLAYRYRDYVIRSLNADKPLDVFVREQLAGDELAGFRAGQPTTNEAIDLLIATHFLRNGQDGTDIGVQEPEAFEIDRRAALEAAVQVTASSLLGLTVHCARCHDHKFEPITQQEYYQFQAILFPAFNPQDWVNPKDRTIYAYLPGEKEAWETKEARLKLELARIREEFTAWIAAHREPSEQLLHERFEDDEWKSRWSNTAPGDDHPGGTVAIDSTTPHAAQVLDGALRIHAGPGEAWLSTTLSVDWTPDRLGDWVQATFELVDSKTTGGPAERIGYVLAAHDFDDSGSIAGGNLLIDGNPTTATQLYADYPGADHKILGQIGQQGYVPGRNYGVRVTKLENSNYRLEHLLDGLPDGKSLEVTEADLPNGGFAFLYCSGRSFVVDEVRIERSVESKNAPIDIAALRREIEARRKTYEQQRSAVEAQRSPEPGRAIAWVTDKSARLPDVPLLTRGLYHLRGPNVEPGALSMLTDPGHEYQPRKPSSDATTTGRRLGFADWLLRAEGRPAALLARVHVNRIWREYFGRGIVATTDNLGQSGAVATHPELLDELAAGLIQSGWSQKAMHRRILLSTVYRQSSAPRAEGLSADPDNRLYWRWPVRRLQAEMIRDSMLATAGRLDVTPFGPYVPTQQTAVGEVVVNEQTAGARRSVYLQQRRSQTLSLLKVFDAPAIATVCTTRPSSTVPLQSLALLNSDFAVQTSEAFARRVLSETDGSDLALIRRAWEIALSRAPTQTEETYAQEFLAGQRGLYQGDAAQVLALADFCQILLAGNSFLYLE